MIDLVAWFFAGAFLANAVPHFVMGTTGRPFPTPFASPPGVGDSSAAVNVLWGLANLFAGLALLHVGEHSGMFSASGAATGAGAAAMGLLLASHFGKRSPG